MLRQDHLNRKNAKAAQTGSNYENSTSGMSDIRSATSRRGNSVSEGSASSRFDRIRTSVFGRNKTPFFERSSAGLSQRFPVYLALIDLLFDIPRIIDHLILLFAQKWPSKPVIQTFAALTQTSIFSNMCIIICFMLWSLATVLLGKKNLGFGPYDIGLAVMTLTIPMIMLGIGVHNDVWGPDRYW